MQHIFHGEKVSDSHSLQKYKTDASVFSIAPQIVYYPKNTEDVISLVHLCHAHRAQGEKASLTVRAGGTCMSGGPLTSDWIVDMTRHMTHITIDEDRMTATVEMGAYFRDIEEKAGAYGLMFPSYPSSHLLCGIGGMIGNNASGEKSLRHGPTSANILSLEVVLSDGSVRQVSPKDLQEPQDHIEKELVTLYETYSDNLCRATGRVPKAASGYRLEKVIQNGTLNEIPLFVGAQGTLGIVTRAVLRLVPIPEYLDLLLISAQSLRDISHIIDITRKHNPEGLETFDQNTFQKAVEFLPDDAGKMLPYIDTNAHLFILAQFSEESEEATHTRRDACLTELTNANYFVRQLITPEDVEAVWHIRRNSFLLMRDHNPPHMKAVPCIEDVIVPVDSLHIFITKLSEILERNNIEYGFHGHIGDGSLRIIPIFDFTSPTLVTDIVELMTEVFSLTKSLHGNMSADHSDGIIRTPFLKEFYGEEISSLFHTIKHLYDPMGILNPGKKTHGTIADIEKYLNR